MEPDHQLAGLELQSHIASLYAQLSANLHPKVISRAYAPFAQAQRFLSAIGTMEQNGSPMASDESLPIPPYPFRHFSRSNDPLRLCELCKNIQLNFFSPDGTALYRQEHQPTFSALCQSAWNGCELCALLLDGHLDMWCRSENVSLDAAVHSNINLDGSVSHLFVVTMELGAVVFGRSHDSFGTPRGLTTKVTYFASLLPGNGKEGAF